MSRSIPSRHPYRVFISYSSDEEDKALQVFHYLKHSLLLAPRMAPNLPKGEEFVREIKQEISCAHLLLPLLTKDSVNLPWVNQEIGFAMGTNIPVLPLRLTELPRGFAEALQAVPVKEDLSDIDAVLPYSDIDRVVSGATAMRRGVFESAPSHLDRTKMLVEGIERTLKLAREHVLIRQMGAISSFSLPDVPESHDDWKAIDGFGEKRNEDLRRLLALERGHLEAFSREAGCKLILDPGITYTSRGQKAFIRRLEILTHFLEDMSDERVDVVFSDSSFGANVLMVGDWFLAESITPVANKGFLQTLGSWHAPTVLRRIREFDREWNRLLRVRGWNEGETREPAIAILKEFVALLKADPAATWVYRS